MSGRFNLIYRLKLLVLAGKPGMGLLTILDNIYQVVCLPFGYLAYRMCRLLERPYFGVWLHSAQGNPFRRRYMAASVDHLVAEKRRLGQTPETDPIRILELGGYAGSSAIQWGSAVKGHGLADAKVYIVDPWTSYLDVERNRRLPYRIMNYGLATGRILALFEHNVRAAGLSNVCIPIKGDSADALTRFGENSCDLVYIDGDHRVEAVMADIERSLAMLKDGGLLCGDDLEAQLADIDADYARRSLDQDMAVDPKTGIAYHPGVTVAVAEFFGRRVACFEGFWVVRKTAGGTVDVDLASYL